MPPDNAIALRQSVVIILCIQGLADETCALPCRYPASGDAGRDRGPCAHSSTCSGASGQRCCITACSGDAGQRCSRPCRGASPSTAAHLCSSAGACTSACYGCSCDASCASSAEHTTACSGAAGQLSSRACRSPNSIVSATAAQCCSHAWACGGTCRHHSCDSGSTASTECPCASTWSRGSARPAAASEPCRDLHPSDPSDRLAQCCTCTRASSGGQPARPKRRFRWRASAGFVGACLSACRLVWRGARAQHQRPARCAEPSGPRYRSESESQLAGRGGRPESELRGWPEPDPVQ